MHPLCLCLLLKTNLSTDGKRRIVYSLEAPENELPYKFWQIPGQYTVTNRCLFTMERDPASALQYMHLVPVHVAHLEASQCFPYGQP